MFLEITWNTCSKICIHHLKVRFKIRSANDLSNGVYAIFFFFFFWVSLWKHIFWVSIWIASTDSIYHISELIMAISIQGYDKNHFSLIQFKKRDYLKFYKLSYATFYDCINNIDHFIRAFSDNKISNFEECGALIAEFYGMYGCIRISGLREMAGSIKQGSSPERFCCWSLLGSIPNADPLSIFILLSMKYSQLAF